MSADSGARGISSLARQPRTAEVWDSPSSPSRIPLPLTPIVGRDNLIARVRDLFDAHGARIVTLTGPGGIGKTRLAMEIAVRSDAEYADGAAFVAFTAEHDGSRVPHLIASSLGIQPIDRREITEVLAGALRLRHLLLILDNLETIAESAAPWIADLLARCPRLHILTTSRIALQIQGERRLVVPPLTVPTASPSLTAVAAQQGSAVALFAARATEARDDFTLDDMTAGPVAAICARLDGIPLAIELAAARIVAMSPSMLLQRLDRHDEILAGSRPDLPERHRTMTRAIAWSYDLLSRTEQRLFRHLAVWVERFDVEAVEYIAASDEQWPADASATDTLQVLAIHSLITSSVEPDGTLAFRMLEPIRLFALSRLEEAGEDTFAQDVHAALNVDLAERAWKGMKGSEQIRWIHRLEAELANLEAASAWLRASDRVEDNIRLELSISLFRHLRGHTSDLVQVYDQFLSHPRIAGASLARGRALLCRGSLAQTRYDAVVAMDTLDEAAVLLRRFDAREFEGAAHWLIGNVHLFLGDPDSADVAFGACLEIGRALGDSRLIGVGLSHLGVSATMRGELDRAERTLHDAMDVGEAAGDVWVISMIQIHLAQVAIARGVTAEAEARLRDAEPLLRDLGDKVGLLRLLVMIAETAGRAGNEAIADKYLDDSLADARTLGDKAYAGRILVERCRRAMQRRDLERAVRDVRDALRIYADLGQSMGISRCLILLATIARDADQASHAARLLGMADRRAADAGLEHASADDVEDLRAFLRTDLGERPYAEAHAVGMALGPDEAVGEALHATLPNVAERTDQRSDVTAGITTRELEVLRLLADGLSNEEIADQLFISTRTVAGHVAKLLAKLDLRSRTAAVAYAVRNGLA